MSTLVKVKEEKHMVRVSTQLVSPELAKSWLEHNTKNRTLRDNRVGEILGWMKRGEWKVTTDAIGFDLNGVLNNGQHRLAALIRYGKPLEFLVARNMSEDAFNVIDTNKVRSATDVLGVNDFSCPAIKSGIIRFLLTYRKGTTITAATKGSIRISNEQILEFAQRNVDKLNEAGIIASRVAAKFRGVESRYIGGLWWVFAEKDKAAAELFFNSYADGMDLTPNDPILVLRNKLIQNMASNKKVSPGEKLAWVIIAWNHTRSGKKVKIIKWSEKDSEFPKPI